VRQKGGHSGSISGNIHRGNLPKVNQVEVNHYSVLPRVLYEYTIMAELRQRQGPVSGIEKPSASLNRYQKTARPPPKRPTRHIHISITLLILACFIIYANNQRHTKKPIVYEVGNTNLPEWYGICSREGKKIYTVPVDSGVGAVECVVVGGKEVKDVGSLGGLSFGSSTDDSPHKEEMGR
jgi:hypothetical protein